MELAIDTSTRFASIGLSRNGEPVVELTWRSERNHSIELVPSIMSLLECNGISVSELDAIYIASGPGGFSALRVGMSAAKAMAMSLDIPLVAVGSLDIEAQPYLGLGCAVCALVGAGRRRVYLGIFAHGVPRGDIVVEHDELVDTISYFVSMGAIICGEGVSQTTELLRDAFGPYANIVELSPPTRRAGTLASIGYRELQAGRVADALTLEPLYLRSSQVSTAQRTWRNT